MVEQRVNTSTKRPSVKRVVGAVLGLSTWTIAGFYIGQFIVIALLQLAVMLGADFSGINEAIFNTVVTAFCYVAALALVIGAPWLLLRHKTSRKDVGLHRLPTWTELGLAPAGLVVYFIASALVMAAVMSLVPGFEVDQVQNVGFENLVYRYEYIVAFLMLVIIAPVAEEILFRGYLYGKLKKYIPWWGAALGTSVLFGLAHGQWNVAVDTFVLGMFLSGLREFTGSLWPAIILHMLKNAIAYYFLFINPTFINTLGG